MKQSLVCSEKKKNEPKKRPNFFSNSQSSQANGTRLSQYLGAIRYSASRRAIEPTKHVEPMPAAPLHVAPTPMVNPCHYKRVATPN
jgi:hypothetical protein